MPGTKKKKVKNTFSITEMLSEIYKGFSDQHDREYIGMKVRGYFKLHKIVPDAKQTEEWCRKNFKDFDEVNLFRKHIKNRIKP